MTGSWKRFLASWPPFRLVQSTVNTGTNLSGDIEGMDPSYSVKACYLQQSSKKTLIDQWPWKLIWRTKLPPEVINFSWNTLRDSCLTQNNLMRRKFQIVNRCYMCLCNSESINHLFLRCTVAIGLWNMFFSLFGLTWVMPRSLREAFVCWSSWKVGKSIKRI